MLRLLMLVLLLANVGYYAWTQGQLTGIVSAPPHQREPERLQQQVRPEAIQLGPPGASPQPVRPAGTTPP
jgi:hypothetical protein